MKRILFILMMAASTAASAQMLQERKKNLSDGSVLTYQTVNDKLSGLYIIKKGDVDLERGNYLNGKRVGNWYFFGYDKSFFLRYNYDQKKVLFIDSKTLAVGAVKFEGNIDTTQASVPIPIASLHQYAIFASESAKKVLTSANISGRGSKMLVTLVAYVKTDGTATYAVRYRNKGAVSELPFTLDNNELEWVPAAFQGNKIASEYSLKAEISFEPDEGLHRRFNWF